MFTLFNIFRYSVCIRQEQGHCCVSYILCQDETKAWSIDLTADGTPTGKTGDDCTGDYIGISGASDVCTPQSGRTLTSRICGAAVFTADAGIQHYTLNWIIRRNRILKYRFWG